jgi:type IV pilus assembly protein PilF
MMIRASILLVSFLTFWGCAPDIKRLEEAQLHFQIAQDLNAKGDNIRAMVEATKAADLDPNYPEVQNFLGALYYQRGEVPIAEKHFRKAVSLNKEYSEARNNLCVLLMQKSLWDEALQHCSEAVKNISYTTPERAYHNMGHIFEQKRDPAKAVEMYRRALNYNKNFVLSLLSLSQVYLKQNNVKEALPLLENAVKACGLSPKGSWGPVCPESYWELSKLYIQMKKRVEAIATLKECEKSDDAKGEYGQKCRDKLKLYR